MKPLTKFILEKFEKNTLKNLKVVYDVQPESITLEVPENYSESQMQIYLGDRFYESLPAAQDNVRRLFGKNAEYIDDAYFEYESITHDTDTYNKDDFEADIEWDSQYDKNAEGKKMNIFTVKNMKYVILFSDFEIYCETDDDIVGTIEKIFKATDSDKVNDYPIKIIYNPDETKYEKNNETED